MFSNKNLKVILILGVIFFSSLEARDTFEEYKNSQLSKFKKYKDDKDNAFAGFLKTQWKEFSKFKGEPLYEKPKPKVLAKAKVVKAQSVGPSVFIKLKKKKSIYVKPFVAKNKDINLKFFGTRLAFKLDKNIKTARFYPRNKQGVSNFFDKMASSDYKPFIKDLQEVSKKLNLNGWAQYILLNDIGLKIFTKSDEAKLFSWFVLNKLGINTKVGLLKSNIILLSYSKDIIYSTPNYIIGGKKYYALEKYNKKSLGRITTYKQDYPQSNKPIDFSLSKLPKLTNNPIDRRLSFSSSGKKYNIKYSYNKNLIFFMATYPQVDYKTFFNASIEDITYRGIALSLKPYINDTKVSDGINFILHFVQKAFVYQRDDDQFKREKVMFAQETLHYKKSDCEDRVMLFSYLVTKLFNYKVVGVKYSDHMSSALYIPMSGDSVNVKNKRFVIADPTYINASIGQSMRKYKKVKPEGFIFINKN